MSKLMRAIYKDYQVIPKQIKQPTPDQQTIIIKRRKFKIICRTIGSSLFLSGVGLFYASKKEQEKYLCPWWDIKKIPPRLVTTGPYRYSRNPMYLAYLIMYTATGIFCLNWILLSVPCFGVCGLAYNFYNDTYIPIEEDKLMRKFGEKYVIYKHITPKWIGFPKDPTPQSTERDFEYV